MRLSNGKDSATHCINIHAVIPYRHIYKYPASGFGQSTGRSISLTVYIDASPLSITWIQR